MMKRTRLLLIDDHELVRVGLRDTLAREADLEVVGAFATPEELYAQLGETACDVLLLDLGLANESGMDVLATVTAEFPATAVLVLSGHSESKFALSTLRAGARGFINKGAKAEELLRAIRTVARGTVYTSPELAQQLEGGGIGTVEPHHRLSPRELSILIALARGRSVTELGQDLDLSVKTVSTYRSRILEKLDLKTNADLTAYALRCDLLA